MNPRYYRLDGNTAVPCDAQEWACSLEFDIEDTRIKLTEFPTSDVYVSTVFLGLDYSFADNGPPILFETKVFGLTDKHKFEWRCSTWHEAMAMHVRAVVCVSAVIVGTTLEEMRLT